MGFGGFLKGLGKGIAGAVSRPVRGLGRIARGKFREGFADIAHGAKRGAQAAALVGTGGMAAPALLAAGAGGLERGLEHGFNVGNVAGGAARGAAGAYTARGVGNIGRMALGGGGAASMPPAYSATETPSGFTRASEFAPMHTSGAMAPPAVEMAPSAVHGVVKSAGSATGPRFRGIGKMVQDAAGGVGRFIKDNPELSLMTGGELLQSSSEMDLRRDEEERRRRELEWMMGPDRTIRDLIVSGAWR